jgi:tetratricopeptide (TPR) repeat protein
MKKVFSLLVALLLITASAFGDDATDYYNSGNAKIAKGDLDGAIADYTKAIELKPDDAETYIIRGRVKKAKGDLDGAIADYTKAIELKPDDAEIYIIRAIAKAAKNDSDGTLADCNKAIELQPNNAEAYMIRGVVKQFSTRDRSGSLRATKPPPQIISRNVWPRMLKILVNIKVRRQNCNF